MVALDLDILYVSYFNANAALNMTLNADTTAGTITAGTNQVAFKNIERLMIGGTRYDDIIIGGNGDDILVGGDHGNDIVKGGAGNDELRSMGTTDIGTVNW